MSIAAADLTTGSRPDAEGLLPGLLLALLLAATTTIAALDRTVDPTRAVCRQPAPLAMGYFLLH